MHAALCLQKWSKTQSLEPPRGYNGHYTSKSLKSIEWKKNIHAWNAAILAVILFPCVCMASQMSWQSVSAKLILHIGIQGGTWLKVRGSPKQTSPSYEDSKHPQHKSTQLHMVYTSGIISNVSIQKKKCLFSFSCQVTVLWSCSCHNGYDRKVSRPIIPVHAFKEALPSEP